MPDGPAYETTGGYVMAELGRVPEVGDSVDLPGWRVSVLAMDGMRVDRLRFEKTESDETEGEESRWASPSGSRSSCS